MRQSRWLSVLIRYPEALAEGYDNTGCRYRTLTSDGMNMSADSDPKVLLEAPFDPIRRQMNSVLLTIDLTKAVADEAIERKDCVVVSYRMPVDVQMQIGNCLCSIDPIIFRDLKSLTLADSQQQSLLRLALEGISVCLPIQ